MDKYTLMKMVAEIHQQHTITLLDAIDKFLSHEDASREDIQSFVRAVLDGLVEPGEEN